MRMVGLEPSVGWRGGPRIGRRHGKVFAFSMNLHASSREKVRERCLRPRAGLANMPDGIEE
jgi:hypothetical protein